MLNRKPRERKKLDAEQLWTYALRSMGQRAQTTAEIRSKLRLRAAAPEDIETVVAKLEEYGLIDDRRFAETFAQSRLENQGFGQGRALRDLQARKIAPALAEQTVQRLYSEQNEIELIEGYLRRKYRTADRETLFQEQKEMASAFRRLRLAGFSSGNVIKVLKQFAANPEMLDGVEEQEKS